MSIRDTDSNKFVAALAIIATPFALGAFLMGWAPANQYGAADPKIDGYVQPRSISDLVDKTSESTVTVLCEVSKNNVAQGTAWAIELETAVSDVYPTTLITNHHVIEDCIGGEGKVTIRLPGQYPRKAVIVKWDADSDLAVLATKSKYPALALAESDPYAGYWVMAFGSADGYAGSVALGNVLNVTGNDILITNNISHGNSGGPLLDNEGNVVGVTTWGSIDEQYNIAVSLDAFCAKILDCQYEYEGEKTWWDYS
jgi:S1-C subfamily serine protease